MVCGIRGGEIVFNGDRASFLQDKESGRVVIAA